MATDRTATKLRPREPGGAGGVLPQRVVVRLLVVLAAAAGCLDAVCVTRLGSVFASVITGNLVQLGRAVATVDGRLAVGATTAVGAYALGVTAGVVGLGRCGAGWCRRTSMVAACEVVLLAGVAAGWLASGVHPGRITSPITTDRLLTGVPSALRGAAIIAIHNRECSVLPWPATARIYR